MYLSKNDALRRMREQLLPPAVSGLWTWIGVVLFVVNLGWAISQLLHVASNLIYNRFFGAVILTVISCIFIGIMLGLIVANAQMLQMINDEAPECCRPLLPHRKNKYNDGSRLAAAAKPNNNNNNNDDDSDV